MSASSEKALTVPPSSVPTLCNEQLDVKRDNGSKPHTLEKRQPRGWRERNTRPTNERLLSTAFVSFLSFAILELVFAFIANSEAMKGDGAAMIVDSMTYLFNWIAEYRKNHFNWEGNDDDDCKDPVRALLLKQRAYRKRVLYMEIGPPLLSVMTLAGVTFWITFEAVQVLMGNAPTGDEPRLGLMITFSAINLSLDVFNVCYFSKARDPLAHYSTDHTASETLPHESLQGEESTRSLTGGEPANVKAETTKDIADYVVDTDPELASAATVDNTCCDCNLECKAAVVDDDSCCDCQHTADDACCDCCEEKQDSNKPKTIRINLNMCSAFTHVSADTLRSLAVVLAATFAVIFKRDPEHADATAALAVSILILFGLMPLVRGLIHSIYELHQVFCEERQDNDN